MESIEINICQGKKSIKQSPEKAPNMKLLLWRERYSPGIDVTICTDYCQSGRLIWASLLRVPIRVLSHTTHMMTFIPQPFRKWNETTWPKSLIINHVVRLSCGQSPRQTKTFLSDINISKVLRLIPRNWRQRLALSLDNITFYTPQYPS